MLLSTARATTDALFAQLDERVLYDRPIAERHRVIFYVGHLEAFDANLLRDGLGATAFDAALDRLFAFGIDPVDGRLPQDAPTDWPRPDQVRRYVEETRRRLDAAVDSRVAKAEALHERLHVAVEHRLMHAETLAYMLHHLPHEAKKGRTPPDLRSEEVPPTPDMADVPAGVATLGARRGSLAFGWDNEYEAVEAEVGPFAIDRFMVTNAQFLAFVEAGGYQERSLWPQDAWVWLRREGVRHPVHWRHEGGRWRWRGMFETRPLPAGWPAYVSHAEAAAYAAWAGKALPTEAEWHRAAYGTPGGEERAYPWGDAAPTGRHGNFDMASWEPGPVGAHPAGRSAFGVAGLLGNGWEWTATPFAPFAGFEPRSYYAGYSADFFDGRHYVLKGGSPRTAAAFLRRSFRNWFQPHYPHVYAGFRCVER